MYYVGMKVMDKNTQIIDIVSEAFVELVRSQHTSNAMGRHLSVSLMCGPISFHLPKNYTALA